MLKRKQEINNFFDKTVIFSYVKEMEQIEFIRKLAVEGVKEKEIEEQLHHEFGQRALKKTAIYKHMGYAKLGVQPPSVERTPVIRVDTQLMSRIIDTLHEEPYDSVRGIADKLNTPPTTIYRYLTQHLHMKFAHTKWIPHFLNECQKMKRADESRRLAYTLKCCKHYSFRNIITGDESWFYVRHNVSGAWVFDDDNTPICESDKFSVMKIMVTVMWNVQDFYIIDFLP